MKWKVSWWYLPIIRRFWPAYTLLDDLHDQTKSEALAGLLSDMNRFVFSDQTPADPATWMEWVACSESIQNGGLHTANNAFQTLFSFLQFNEEHYGYKANLILKDIQTSSHQKRWNQLLEKATMLKEGKKYAESR